MASLPPRLDDDQLAYLARVADFAPPALQKANEDQVAQALRLMDILPRRADDDVRGALRQRIYFRKLSGYSYEALMRMVSKAIDTLDWFPSVAQCLALLDAQPSTPDQCRAISAKARILTERELQARQDEALQALKMGQMDNARIAQLDKRTAHIAHTLGYVWHWPDGSYTARLLPDPSDEAASNAAREHAQQWKRAWDEHRAQNVEQENEQ